MIKNDSLENRLNAHRDGEEIPDFHNEFEEPLKHNNQEDSSLYNLLLYIIQIFSIIFKSFVYGFTLKLLLKSDWNIISLFIVGLSINFLLETLGSFFEKK